MKIKIGDTVMFTSGGHLMTVVGIDEDVATLAWSVEGDIKLGAFPCAALIKATKASR